MRVYFTTYVTANEAGEHQIEIKYQLNWFDQLLGRPSQKVFVKPRWGLWVEKQTREVPTLGEAAQIAQVLDAAWSEEGR
jgi:hypothetical protein